MVLVIITLTLRYVPSLLDDNIVSDSRQLAARSEQSMLDYYDGNLKEAAKRGFRQVTHPYILSSLINYYVHSHAQSYSFIHTYIHIYIHTVHLSGYPTKTVLRWQRSCCCRWTRSTRMYIWRRSERRSSRTTYSESMTDTKEATSIGSCQIAACILLFSAILHCVQLHTY